MLYWWAALISALGLGLRGISQRAGVVFNQQTYPQSASLKKSPVAEVS
jgi:hypothetical protein